MTTLSTPRLWTVYLDTFGTGEGRTLMAAIGYASSEEQAKALFREQFGDWAELGCYAVPGVGPNPVVDYLFSPAALQTITQNEGRANIVAHASVHINAS